MPFNALSFLPLKFSAIRRFARPLRPFLALTLNLFLLVHLTSCVTSDKKRVEADARLRLGTSFITQGNYPAALKELLQAEQLDPENAMIENNLGLVYFVRNHFDVAETHLARAVELNQTYSDARNNHARVLIELGNYDQAEVELKQVLSDLTYGEPAKAWMNLGLCSYRRGNFKDAKEQFSQALELDRNLCFGQDMYGRSLLELGELAQAAKALDNASVICKPSNFDEPQYYSGLTYYKLGKTSFAIARLEEVIKLNPNGKYAKKAESMLKLMK